MKKILSSFVALLVIIAVALFTFTSAVSPADELLTENLAALAQQTGTSTLNLDEDDGGGLP